MIDRFRVDQGARVPDRKRENIAGELLTVILHRISSVDNSYTYARFNAARYNVDVNILVSLKRFAELELTLPLSYRPHLEIWANNESLREMLEETVTVDELFESPPSIDIQRPTAIADVSQLPREIVGHALPLLLGTVALDDCFREYWFHRAGLDWFFVKLLGALIWYGIMLDQRYPEPIEDWLWREPDFDVDCYLFDVDCLFDEDALDGYFTGWSKDHASLVREEHKTHGVTFMEKHCELPPHEQDMRAQIVRLVLAQIDDPLQRWQLLYPYWEFRSDLDLTLATTLISLPGLGIRLNSSYLQPTLQWISTCQYGRQIAELCDLRYAFNSEETPPEMPVLRRIVKL